jgi:hypothetical protein
MLSAGWLARNLPLSFGMDVEYIYPTATSGLDRFKDRPSADELGLLKGDGMFSFGDLIDVVNPLQQLPIIGSIYRSLTGDTISTGARLAGGFLMGGPLGFMVAAINAGLEAATGGDVAEHMYAMVTGSSEHQYAMNAYKKADQLS